MQHLKQEDYLIKSSKKSTGLTPLKAGLPTEKYGGYNKAGVMFLYRSDIRVEKRQC